jgi:hypothetical protein
MGDGMQWEAERPLRCPAIHLKLTINGVDGMRACPRRDALSSQYALEVQKETGNEEG